MDKQTGVCISCFKSVGHMADCVKEEGGVGGGGVTPVGRIREGIPLLAPVVLELLLTRLNVN